MKRAPSLDLNDVGFTRRTVVGGLAGLAATSALGRPVLAQDAPFTFKVGAATVTVLSDGNMTLPPSVVLPGRDPAEIDAAFKAVGQAPSFLSQVNVALVRIGAETILIDTGGGPDFMPTLGKLVERLEAAGIAPESITRVIFTHAHPDHLWGVVDPLGGGSLFEKAEHVMSEAEFAFWIAPDVDARMSEGFKGMAAGTNRRLKALADTIQRRKAGTEVVPGVALVDTPGHTPGHVSVLVRSGTEQLLIGGDVLTQVAISFARPDWQWGSDFEPELGAKSRRRILDQLAVEKTRLLGYHLPWPGLGYVERKDTAWRFVPV